MISNLLKHNQSSSVKPSSLQNPENSNQGSLGHKNRLLNCLSGYFNTRMPTSSKNLINEEIPSIKSSTKHLSNTNSTNLQVRQEALPYENVIEKEPSIPFSNQSFSGYSSQQIEDKSMLLDSRHPILNVTRQNLRDTKSAVTPNQNRIEHSSRIHQNLFTKIQTLENNIASHNESHRKNGNAPKSRGSALYKNLSKLMGENKFQEPTDLRIFPMKGMPVMYQTPSSTSADTQLSGMRCQDKMNEELHYESTAIMVAEASAQIGLTHERSNPNSQVSQKRMKKLWNAETDKTLHDLLEAHGRDWNKIASAFGDPRITPLAAKERYLNSIRPENKKTRFSLQEDEIIKKYYNLLGPNWQAIASHLPGRTESMVRNRFYCYIKKKNLHCKTQAGVDDNEKYTGKFSESELYSKKTENVTPSTKISDEPEEWSKDQPVIFPQTQAIPSSDFPNFNTDKLWKSAMVENGISHQREDNFDFNPFDLESSMCRENNHEMFLENTKATDRVGFHQADEIRNLDPSMQMEPTHWNYDAQPQALSDNVNNTLKADEPVAHNSEPLQDPFLESLLNLRDSDNNLATKEPLLLSPVFGSPFFEGLSKRNEPLQFDLKLNDDQFRLTEERVQKPSQQCLQVALGGVGQEEATGQQKPKNNNLEALLKQLQSIHMLFDMTRREINALQSSFGTK